MKYLRVQQNGKYGYIDRDSNLVSELRFKHAGFFSEGIALVRYDNNEDWVIDENFENLFILPGESYSVFSEGLLSFRRNDKAGYLDKTGKTVIDPQFKCARSFENGYANIEIKEKWGLIDKVGNQIILPTFNSIDTVSPDGIFTYSFSMGKEQSKFGLINIKSEVLIKPKYTGSHGYNEGLVCVRDTDYEHYGYIDIGDNWIIKPIFDDATIFKNGTAGAGIDDKWGIINKAGDWIIDPIYTLTCPFSEDGLAAVYVGGEWDYEYPIGGKWGFINIKGEMVIPPIFDCVTSFKDGISTVDVGDVAGDIDGKYKTGYIDINGNYIWEPSS